MLASASAADMTLSNLAYTLIVRAVQESPTVSNRSVASNDQGTRASTPLASSQPAHHIDMKA